MKLISNLLDLQQELIQVETKVFKQNKLDESRTACLIPLISESFNIYQVLVFLIKKLAEDVENANSISFITERFYQQFIDLQSFYSHSNSVRAVSSVIAVPTLPKDPPVFFVPKKPSTPKVQRAKPVEEPKPEPKPVEQPKPVPVRQTQSLDHPKPAFNPFLSDFQVSQPSKIEFNPFEGFEKPKPVVIEQPKPVQVKQTQSVDSKAVVSSFFQNLDSVQLNKKKIG